jgi:hypothetical protein
MALIFPLSLTAADVGSAMLHSSGGVSINGNEAPDSSAIFAGDVIETKSGSAANLNADGSAILIQPESVVRFQGNSLILEHGSVAVGTSKGVTVQVTCIAVTPATNDWTQYEVSDVNRIALVAAKKLDVTVNRAGPQAKPGEPASALATTLHEGQQKTFDELEACGAPKRPGGAGARAINPKWLGAGAGSAVLIAILLRGGSGSKPVSPSSPSRTSRP